MREGVWAKMPKPSHCGSISGMPSEMGMESSEGRWWGIAFKNMRRERGFGPKPETKPLWLDFRYTMRNGDGEQ